MFLSVVQLTCFRDCIVHLTVHQLCFHKFLHLHVCRAIPELEKVLLRKGELSDNDIWCVLTRLGLNRAEYRQRAPTDKSLQDKAVSNRRVTWINNEEFLLAERARLEGTAAAAAAALALKKEKMTEKLLDEYDKMKRQALAVSAKVAKGLEAAAKKEEKEVRVKERGSACVPHLQTLHFIMLCDWTCAGGQSRWQDLPVRQYHVMPGGAQEMPCQWWGKVDRLWDLRHLGVRRPDLSETVGQTRSKLVPRPKVGIFIYFINVCILYPYIFENPDQCGHVHGKMRPIGYELVEEHTLTPHTKVLGVSGSVKGFRSHLN